MTVLEFWNYPELDGTGSSYRETAKFHPILGNSGSSLCVPPNKKGPHIKIPWQKLGFPKAETERRAAALTLELFVMVFSTKCIQCCN